MKTAVIFGAGQAGQMCFNLLNYNFKVAAFADNDESKIGGKIKGIPIISPEMILSTPHDYVILGVVNKDRQAQMEKQLIELGCQSEIILWGAFSIFDPRNASVRLLAEEARKRGVLGDTAEVGVFRGAFASVINEAFPERTIHLFDTFSGFPAKDAEADRDKAYSNGKTGDFSNTDVNTILKALPYPENAVIHKGRFPETFEGCQGLTFSLVSIDADLYSPTIAALELFWDRLSKGGAIIIHDYNSRQYEGAGAAAREFCAKRGLFAVPLGDFHGSAVIIKQGAV